jgi:hypothetical protein
LDAQRESAQAYIKSQAQQGSPQAQEAFRAAQRAEYEALDRACEALTTAEGYLGSYVLIEPLPKKPAQPTGPA